MILKSLLLEVKPDRVYILISPTARTDLNWPLKGYAGPSGRIDEIARSFLSLHRRSSLMISILMGPPNPPLSLIYNPTEACGLNSERKTVLEIRRAMRNSRCIRAGKMNVEEVVSILRRMNYKITLLSEHGTDISNSRNVKGKTAFLLGAHIDIPQNIIDNIKEYIVDRVSIGPLSYQASQVIAYLEWEAEACK